MNSQDPIVDDREILSGAEAVTSTEGILVAQAGVPKKTAEEEVAPKLKKTRVLLVAEAADKTTRDMATVYARQVLKLKENEISTDVKFVNSWQELARLLQEYESIDQLVLDFHGVPGGITIGTETKSLDKVDEIFRGQKPKIRQIDFEGCSTGERASELVHFGRLFSTSRVTAWNFFRVTQPIEVEVPSDVDVKKLDSMLAPYRGYFLKGTPSSDELAKKKGKHTLVVEWFRTELDFSPLPPPPPPGGLDERPVTFKPRDAATSRLIKSSEVGKYKPTPALEHVIIVISD
jgi:hypothetical protein